MLSEDANQDFDSVGILQNLESGGQHREIFDRLEHERQMVGFEQPQGLDKSYSRAPCQSERSSSSTTGRQKKLTEYHSSRGDGLLDLLVRLGEDEENGDDLGFGALGQIVVVLSDIDERRGQRLEEALVAEDSAEVVARRRTLK